MPGTLQPLDADHVVPAEMFNPALTYYRDGTAVVMRWKKNGREQERSGVTCGLAPRARTYAFQAVRWPDGTVDLVAPQTLRRAG